MHYIYLNINWENITKSVPCWIKKKSRLMKQFGNMVVKKEVVLLKLFMRIKLNSCLTEHQGKVRHLIFPTKNVVYAESTALSGPLVYKTWLGQRFDAIFSLVTVPGGFALFECCWLSRVAPCYSSVIEGWLREDETEWDMEVNEDSPCLKVVFITSWIIHTVLQLHTCVTYPPTL